MTPEVREAPHFSGAAAGARQPLGAPHRHPKSMLLLSLLLGELVLSWPTWLCMKGLQS